MKWLMISVLVGLGVSKMLMSEVRGLRNNNPGNIRWDGHTQWEGMTGVDDKNFIIFESAEYGIRAMARVLKSYGRRGVDQMGEIISTWAPSVENDTAAYIASVSSQTGFAANDEVLEMNYPTLIGAIIKHENGKNPYSDSLIRESVAMA